jgi:hypothetical protein
MNHLSKRWKSYIDMFIVEHDEIIGAVIEPAWELPERVAI